MSDAALLRTSGRMSALTAISRVTGFVRILVVAAVLGTTFLGNTYQSANTVPNLVFELFVAGALQAVLVPTLVERLDRRRRHEAEHIAGAILGFAFALLGVLAILGAVAAPWLMRLLVSGVADPAIRDEQVRLGTFFLWFFLPQILFYAAAMVATAVLNAHDRFSLPAAAPIFNNVVVIASYIVFAVMRGGKPPSLDLSTAEKVVLAGGTTLGVVVFCSVPIVAVVRSGFSLRPRFDFTDAAVRRLLRLGGWAALSLAMVQVLIGVVLLLANRVEGGVVAYQVAFTFFLLPHALVAIPLSTASFPGLSRHAHRSDYGEFAGAVGRATRLIGFFVLPATAAFVALAGPMSRLALFGESSGDGAAMVAAALAGFAPGLLGYGLLLLGGRAFAALGDTRTPAIVSVALAAGGAALMVGGFGVATGDARIGGIAAGHSAAYLLASAVLFVLLRVRLGVGIPGLAKPLAIEVLGATLAGAAMWSTERAIGSTERLVTAGEVGAAIVLGAAVYLGVQHFAGGPRPGPVLAALAGRETHHA